MYEKELLENQLKIGQIMKTGRKQPQDALKKIQDLLKDTEQYAGAESAEYYSVTSGIYEAMGDVYMGMKNPQEAEKAFQEMVRRAVKMYELDKEKFDFRIGAANYKLGNFYRTLIGCHMLLPKPKELNEAQKKVFEVADKCFKNAIGYTMQNARKGALHHVELHGTAMEALMILYTAVGDYEMAVRFGKDCVGLSKAVYNKVDDKAHGVALANRMTGLAGVYTFMKDAQPAMENLEDAIFVLEAHEKEDVKIQTMLARNYISVGSCYCNIEEEKENAEEAYKKGLNLMIKLNDQSNNRLINDVIQSYVFVGDYYKKVQNEAEAKAHYAWAMKLASDMFRATKQPRYESLIKQLESKV